MLASIHLEKTAGKMLSLKSDGEVMITARIIDLHYFSVNQVRPGNAKQICHLSYNFLPLDFPETA